MSSERELRQQLASGNEVEALRAAHHLTCHSCRNGSAAAIAACTTRSCFQHPFRPIVGPSNATTSTSRLYGCERQGAHLRALRRAKPMTQSTLAVAVGCSRTLIKEVEAGRRALPEGLRVALAVALGVDLEQLEVPQ